MRSWKSTLIGFIAAALNLIAGGVNWKTAIMSAAIAALGAVTKDYNVTGTQTKIPGGDNASK